MLYFDRIAPVQLVGSEDAIPIDASFEVSGWGTTASGGSISPQLRQVTVPYVVDEECNSWNMYDGRIVGECMICAGEYGKDSCQVGLPFLTFLPFFNKLISLREILVAQ